ncbi:MAG: hypothetical protein EOO63_11645 [Hymenobacter sp.]|nr:MAG: hypothetical protein EOO63_11645 [Hymenobacter sp.]
MKRLLLALFLLWAGAVRAQNASPALAASPYRYCALVVGDRLFLSPDRLQLDYGQGAPGAVADPELADMAKNIRASASVIDALNYLSRHNWEFVNVTTVQTQLRKSSLDDATSYVESETRYLLRRRTP